MNQLKKIGPIAVLALATAVPLSATAAIQLQTDFESATAITDDGWTAYINGFSTDCTTYQGWGYPYPLPNTQVAALAAGASSQVLNVYTNYEDGANQPNFCLETNVYVQFPIAAEDVGDYVLTYDVELPPAEFTGDKVNGFVKALAGDFSGTFLQEVLPSTAGKKTINFSITNEMVGGWLQVGFNNYAHDYEPSGMYYDNVLLALEEPPVEPPVKPPQPPVDREPVNSIPTMDAWGKLALLLTLGIMGVMVLNRRGH
jgi:hypothetical protein